MGVEFSQGIGMAPSLQRLDLSGELSTLNPYCDERDVLLSVS